MRMPGRVWDGIGYRFGFNGKENDNEAKGTANEQDYGMRIYDPRLGRFLSVDPLGFNFPWLTPYQFSGNNPIRFVDLDGGEPQDYTFHWIYKPLFELGTKQEIGPYILITDPQLGKQPIDVELVYDNWSKQVHFIHEDQGHYYYLKNDNGDNSVMSIDPKTNTLRGGHFEPFKTYNEIAYDQTVALANGIATGTVVGVALPFAIEGALSTGPSIGSYAWRTLKVIHNAPELIPYFDVLGLASSVGVGGYLALHESIPGGYVSPVEEALPVNPLPTGGRQSTLRPGPYAHESIPARNPDRSFNQSERSLINDLGDKYGCHTCGTKSPGTKSGNWVPDHQPVSSLKRPEDQQVLYPQCLGCSQRQGGDARAKLAPFVKGMKKE